MLLVDVRWDGKVSIRGGVSRKERKKERNSLRANRNISRKQSVSFSVYVFSDTFYPRF